MPSRSGSPTIVPYLIVDDVEDRSTVRRGGPSCHSIHGDAIAINAGNAAFFLAELLLRRLTVPNRDKLRVYELFFEALRAIPEAGHGRPWEEAVQRAQRLHNADAVLIPLCDIRFYVAHVGELEGYRWYPDNRLPFAEMRWAAE